MSMVVTENVAEAESRRSSVSLEDEDEGKRNKRRKDKEEHARKEDSRVKEDHKKDEHACKKEEHTVGRGENFGATRYNLSSRIRVIQTGCLSFEWETQRYR